MAIAIVVLSSGERVITDLQEVREENKEDGKPVCLMFIRPYNLNVESTDGAVVNQEVQVRFSKWVPYSSDTQFKVPFSSVTAVGAPDPGLAQAYEQTVQQAVAAEQAAGSAREVTQTPPPAAKTGLGLKTSTTCGTKTIVEILPVCPPASVPCATTISVPAAI